MERTSELLNLGRTEKLSLRTKLQLYLGDGCDGAINEQRIQIQADGEVRLTFYACRPPFDSPKGRRSCVDEIHQFRIAPSLAAHLLSGVRLFLEQVPKEPMMGGMGFWEAELTDEEGKKVTAGNSLMEDKLDGVSVTTLLRRSLGRPDLWGFSGHPYRLPAVLQLKSDQYLFVNVAFDEHSPKTYCYLCDDQDVSPGDEVEVPVGDEGERKIVTVRSLQISTRDGAPYPVERCRHVIRVIRDD